ncbi:nitrate ABC transporter substrate-binding protein [Paenibacillus psychroresistens]|uniref:Nitrate ABC transporter substrate-binding protein n=1 Tax=Paenibacillus psychroresistens TaxID=1778678 RepID=A0A6B8RKS3_9BACL|nr:ABC transporter substrate-binding protein [Paenibacillus psychroresistens]QGQ96354.1 nitrate ABC transporter substrate-binding protein [Paenibacillus psychroresistens]
MKHVQAKKGVSRFKILSLSIGLVALLLIQACGNKDTTDTADSADSAAPAASAATQDSAAPAKTDIPKALHIGYIGASSVNLPSLAEGWGFKSGIISDELKKQGITEITFTGFPNGPDLTESLISGRLDVGLLGDTPAILARSNGAKTRLIAQQVVVLDAYIIGKKGGVKTIAELKGKKVATQKGSYMHRYAAGLLKEQNVDVKLIHLLAPDAEAALVKGDIEATTVASANAVKLIAQGYPVLDHEADHANLVGTSTTVVTEDYLSKFPGFPKLWNDLRKQSLADLKTKEDDYYKFATSLGKLPEETVRQASPISSIAEEPFSDAGIQLLEGTKKFLIEEKLAENDFDLNAWILK